MPGHGALTALRALLLLLLGVRPSRADVPPPANVTVSCHNDTVIVSWDYSQDQPQTNFTVIIDGSAGSRNIEPVGHRGDLSKFVWESEERYRGFHHVTVTAERGGNKSKPASKTFSFNDLIPVQTKCVLDFPPVDVVVGDSEATVSFLNPIHLYRPLKRTVNVNFPPIFTFIVSPLRNGTKHAGDFKGMCPHQQHTCKLTVSLIDGDQKCFELSGTLFDSKSINYVKFRETGSVCGLDSDVENILILAGVTMCVVVVVIIVVVLLICWAKAWTMETPNLPQSLKEPKHTQKQLRCLPETTEEKLIHVKVCGPSKYLSDSSEDGDPPQNQRLLAGGKDLHHGEDPGGEDLHHGEDPGGEDHHGEDPGGEGHHGELYTERQLSESSRQELISAESDEDEAVSPYDRPHIHRQDMGDGDFVTAYTGGN